MSRDTQDVITVEMIVVETRADITPDETANNIDSLGLQASQATEVIPQSTAETPAETARESDGNGEANTATASNEGASNERASNERASNVGTSSNGPMALECNICLDRCQVPVLALVGTGDQGLF